MTDASFLQTFSPQEATEVSDGQGANAAPCTPRKGFHPLTLFAMALYGFFRVVCACLCDSLWCTGARALARICEQVHRVLASPILVSFSVAVRGGDLLRRPTGFTADGPPPKEWRGRPESPLLASAEAKSSRALSPAEMTGSRLFLLVAFPLRVREQSFLCRNFRKTAEHPQITLKNPHLTPCKSLNCLL